MSEPERFTLRQLPLPAKLVVTVFLMAVGIGYFSALIQLHFQQATPGEFMPTPANVIRAYHGGPPVYPLASIVEDSEVGWPKSMKNAFLKGEGDKEAFKADVEARGKERVDKEVDSERQLFIAWIKAKAPRDAYDADSFPLVKGFEDITEKFKDGANGKIRSIIDARCVICHSAGGEQPVPSFAFYSGIAKLMQVEPEGRISSRKLAQSTHAHLLSFAMLFTLTGFVFAFTSYPVWFRVMLAPTVLIAQIIDVACWWLARTEGSLGEMFALSILFTGGIVGMGLLLQIILSLFNMYGPGGRTILVLMFLGAGGVGYLAKTKFLDKYLEQEKATAALLKEDEKKPAPKKE